MSMWARVRVIVTGKLLWCRFFGYKISESEQDFGNFQKYLSPKFPAIRYYIIRTGILW